MTISTFLNGHIKLCSSSYDVFIIVNCDQTELFVNCSINATFIHVPINRNIKLINDFFVLFKLLFIFTSYRFDIIHSVTPKAGLIGQIAGWISRVPIRIHIFTGQVWVTKKNPSRFILKLFDTLTGLLATDILVDSSSQRSFLLSERVISANKSQVLNKGSISGVNTKKFYPNRKARSLIRHELSIPEDAFVLLFLGRLNTDKGILDLALAYARIASQNPDLWLLIVGPDEESLTPPIREICAESMSNVVFVNYTSSPESYFNAADLFCLPSYREGFGTSVIEAAACGIPSVASRIYGLTDAVVDGETGLLHTVTDISDLVGCIESLINDRELYKKMADAAYLRAKSDFDQKTLSGSLFNFYQRTLTSKKT
jgi:glycosyltransferase involved in cell wall biosynthesis